MNRRRFLAGSGLALTVCLAGCSTLASEAREGVILTHVELGNTSGQPRVFDVIVTYDDEFIHWDSYEVEAADSEQGMGGRVIEIDSPADPGSTEVYVRVGEKWKGIDFGTDQYDGKRVIVVATYGRPEAESLRLSRVVSDRPVPGNQ